MQQEKISIDSCYTHPHLYRLCHKIECIPWKQKCPCKADTQFRCIAGNCISIQLKCDGVKQCLYGEDEHLCQLEQVNEQNETTIAAVTTEVTEHIRSEQPLNLKSLSTPAVIVIASASVFVVILLVFLLCILIAKRRRKRNNYKDIISARNSKGKTVTKDLDFSSAAQEILSERIYVPLKDKHAKQLHNHTYHSDNKMDNCATRNDKEILEIENNIDSSDDVITKKKNNMAINSGAEIYSTDDSDEYKFRGLGKYSYKPRSKYLNYVIEHEKSEKTREKIFAIKFSNAASRNLVVKKV